MTRLRPPEPVGEPCDGGRGRAVSEELEGATTPTRDCETRRLTNDQRAQPRDAPPMDFPQFLGDVDGSVAFPVCTAVIYEQPR